MEDNTRVCPQCGCPAEDACTSANMDADVLNKGKSTEAEATITHYAEIVLVVGIFMAVIAAMMSIGWAFAAVTHLPDDLGLIVFIMGLAAAVFSCLIILWTAKLIWAVIMLFVNISTTLKRIEIKLGENTTH